MKTSLLDTLEMVRAVTRSQAKYVLSQWQNVTSLAKKDGRDLVTNVDVDVERALKDHLRERFPMHGFWGEESAPERAEAPYQWLIDPIDGTKYYVGHAHLFSISVALLHLGEPILGVVEVPTSRQCFYAASGHGAFLDGVKLSGSEGTLLKQAIVNVDMSGTDRLNRGEREWFEAKLIELTRSAYRVRALGGGALASCWLATGALEGFVDLTGYSKPQDVAAGRIIMKECGAKVEYVSFGVGPRRLLAAPPPLWDQLHALLAS
jgi:myo-inositol-1(or 4)-monophosphatase